MRSSWAEPHPVTRSSPIRPPAPCARRRGPRRGGRVVPGAALAVALLAGPALSSCREPELASTPDGAVRAFVSALARSKNDRRALREVYELLDRPSRRALARRAEEATALAGRRFHPWDMIPQGRVRWRFAPRPGSDGYALERQAGDEAVVRVQGEDPSRSAQVPVVREDEGWRVHLAIPVWEQR